MQGQGLPIMENMPPAPKRKRKASGETSDQMIERFKGLPLETQLSFISLCKSIIDERRQKLKDDLELINGNDK